MKKFCLLLSLMLTTLCLTGADRMLPVSGVLSKPVFLGKHNNLAIEARNTDGKGCRLRILINRELKKGDQASYYTDIALGGTVKTHYVPLPRSMNYTSTFRFRKGSPRCSLDPLNAGRLLSIRFYPDKSGMKNVEIKSLKLTNISKSMSPEMAAAVEKVKKMPLITPMSSKRFYPANLSVPQVSSLSEEAALPQKNLRHQNLHAICKR